MSISTDPDFFKDSAATIIIIIKIRTITITVTTTTITIIIIIIIIITPLLSYFEKIAHVGGLNVCISVALYVRMSVTGANKVEGTMS